jgi:hypothetical protein
MNGWKQVKCPSKGESINQMWYVHTFNGILSGFEKERTFDMCSTWRNLEGTKLSEFSQLQNPETPHNSTYVIYLVDRKISQLDSHEVNSGIYSQLIFDSSAKNTQRRKDSIFKSDGGKVGYPYVEK